MRRGGAGRSGGIIGGGGGSRRSGGQRRGVGGGTMGRPTPGMWSFGRRGRMDRMAGNVPRGRNGCGCGTIAVIAFFLIIIATAVLYRMF